MYAWLALALAAAALQQPETVPPPDDIVRVHAFVADGRNRPVVDLTLSDFELREDGAPRTIQAVRFVRDQPRVLGVYLDEYHVDAEASNRVRDQLLRFVAALGPDDQLVVMKPLDSLFEIRLTRDRERATSAIGSFAGRKGDYRAAHEYERQYMAGTPAAIDASRTQVTVSALNALAVRLGLASADARKTLVIVSEGFGNVERSDRRRNLMLPTIASIVQSANRSNVSIYAVDPGEGLPDEDSEQTLTRLAAETDGVALAGASALEEGLRRAANDASAYYLLTYQSAGKTDNKFHVIEVGVKRGDAKVRTRNGYWSLSPDDLMRAEVLARAKSPPETKPLEPAPRVSPLIRPWFGVSRGDGGMTRVTFVWEAAPQIPGTRSRRPPTRLLLTALGESETPLFEGDVLPVGSATPADETVPKRAVFDVPPGRVRLRMSIADATLAVIDSDVRNIAVRDLGAAVALGSPEVYRARNAREFRALADPMAVPVVTRVFSRTERLIIRVPAYAPEGEPTVSATLMSRLGQPMRPLEISQTPSLKGVSQIDLPLAGLASADYLIEIRASHAAGEAKDTLSFRVTP